MTSSGDRVGWADFQCTSLAGSRTFKLTRSRFRLGSLYTDRSTSYPPAMVTKWTMSHIFKVTPSSRRVCLLDRQCAQKLDFVTSIFVIFYSVLVYTVR